MPISYSLIFISSRLYIKQTDNRSKQMFCVYTKNLSYFQSKDFKEILSLSQKACGNS